MLRIGSKAAMDRNGLVPHLRNLPKELANLIALIEDGQMPIYVQGITISCFLSSFISKIDDKQSDRICRLRHMGLSSTPNTGAGPRQTEFSCAIYTIEPTKSVARISPELAPMTIRSEILIQFEGK